MSLKRLFVFKTRKRKFLKEFKKVELTFTDIFSPLDRNTGQDYFYSIGPKICELSGASHVLIGQFIDKERIESLVFCRGAQLLDKITYSIKDTPCDLTTGQCVLKMTQGAWKKFPADNPIVQQSIEGCVAVTLYNVSNKANGVVWILFEDPLNDDMDVIESLIKMFAPRINSEIEHLLSRDELRRRNAEQELMHQVLKEKNEKLDESLGKLRETQFKSKEYDELKSAFLANLSHEIRTPMNVILGFLELLRSDSLTVGERFEYIDIINDNGMQLLKVMDNLIDISKLQTRLKQEAGSEIKLNSLLMHIRNKYLDEAGAVKRKLSVNLNNGLADGSDLILSDEQALRKVVMHLMDNALKFTRDDGRVDLGYDVINGKLRFFVKDNGIGVPRGQERIIFDMFRQGSESLNREFGGNGLGLAISKKYVETLGGELWLDSEYRDGALFYFTIPYEC